MTLLRIEVVEEPADGHFGPPYSRSVRRYCDAMPYPKKLLNDYETVALDLHPHWSYFAEPALALVAATVLGIVAVVADFPGAVKTIFLILIIAAALWLIARYVKWATTYFVITSDRVIYRSGIIAKHGIEIPLERVNSVIFHQTLLERLVGAGDLLIESGAENGQQRFTDIRNPDKVQNLIHSQMEVNENRLRSGPGAQPLTDGAVASGDTVGQLERLEAMRDRGALSEEDFEAQKRKLLDS